MVCERVEDVMEGVEFERGEAAFGEALGLWWVSMDGGAWGGVYICTS
jgi:hypothetical protein